jgi:hypothetical protein
MNEEEIRKKEIEKRNVLQGILIMFQTKEIGISRAMDAIIEFMKSSQEKEKQDAVSILRTMDLLDKKDDDVVKAVLDSIQEKDEKVSINILIERMQKIKDDLRQKLKAEQEKELKKPKIVDAIKTPDGFSAVVSFPLPENHWIYEEHGKPPATLHIDSLDIRMELESIFKDAVKYAVQASTMSGKDMDFDPDAMIQNFMIALFGYYPLNFPRDTIHVKKQLPNGKVLEYVISQCKNNEKARTPSPSGED